MKPLLASLAVLVVLALVICEQPTCEGQILQPAAPSLNQLAAALTTLIQTGDSTQATIIFEGILSGIIEAVPAVNPITYDGSYEANLLVQQADRTVDAFNQLTGNVLANILFVLNNSVGSGNANDGQLAANLVATIIDGIRRDGVLGSSFEQALGNLYGVGNLLNPPPASN